MKPFRSREDPRSGGLECDAVCQEAWNQREIEQQSCNKLEAVVWELANNGS
jgi:hypothetical protein